MYTLISSVRRKNKYTGEWTTFDIGTEKIENIVDRLGWAVIELKPANTNQTKWVDLVNIEYLFTNIAADATFNDWLLSIGDLTLPFNSGAFYQQNYVKYVQAWHSGYNFQPAHPFINAQADISIYEKSDLIATHPTLSPEYLGNYGLFTVNGLFHISYYGKDELRIIDGFKSVLRYNDNQIGLWSFESLGKINCIPIKTEYLAKYSTNTDYWDNTYITIPSEVDLENKSVFFVIGGYPHFIGKDITPINDRSYSIKFNNIFTIERYFQLFERLNIQSWGLNDDENNLTRINVNVLFSDETMLKLLTMSQSFIVVVDTPTLKQDILPVEYIQLPGRYVDKTTYKLPLCGINGIGLDYHTIKEDIVTVLAASNNRRKNYVVNTLNWTKGNYHDAGLVPYKPITDETAYYRLISN